MATHVEDPESGTAPTVAETIRRLRAHQKNAKGAPAYSRFVNRKAGRVLAAVAFRLGLRPNQVTAISGVFSFVGIALLALVRPSVPLGIVIFLCLALGYAFDSADGQLARLRGGGSVAGEWLDHMIDCAKISSLHLAVAISWYRYGSPSQRGLLLVPLGFAVVAAVSFFGMILNEKLRQVRGLPRSGTGAPSTLRSLMVIPTDYGVLCVAFALLGGRLPFQIVYCFLAAASAGYLLLAAPKWFREMAAIDAAATTSP